MSSPGWGKAVAWAFHYETLLPACPVVPTPAVILRGLPACHRPLSRELGARPDLTFCRGQPLLLWTRVSLSSIPAPFTSVLATWSWDTRSILQTFTTRQRNCRCPERPSSLLGSPGHKSLLTVGKVAREPWSCGDLPQPAAHGLLRVGGARHPVKSAIRCRSDGFQTECGT